MNGRGEDDGQQRAGQARQPIPGRTPENAERNYGEAYRKKHFDEPDGEAVGKRLGSFALGEHELPGSNSEKRRG